jgi:hypothetical protein
MYVQFSLGFSAGFTLCAAPTDIVDNACPVFSKMLPKSGWGGHHSYGHLTNDNQYDFS